MWQQYSNIVTTCIYSWFLCTPTMSGYSIRNMYQFIWPKMSRIDFKSIIVTFCLAYLSLNHCTLKGLFARKFLCVHISKSCAQLTSWHDSIFLYMYSNHMWNLRHVVLLFFIVLTEVTLRHFPRSPACRYMLICLNLKNMTAFKIGLNIKLVKNFRILNRICKSNKMI